eukprot:TRINITY_DN61_c0_g1_i1.p1 TRINITY_DN61_c0_g1~~TRINITY_DN61_c0_g1_i1.p1  ORF type:complete len:318 (-),score=142.16 TRINITY_DN61_c0_g1_i1:108-1025(-)
MMQHLKNTPASELVRRARKLISIDTGTTIDQALSILKRENILSLPVYDYWKEEWVGIVTIQDLLTYVAFGDFKEDGKIAENFANGIKPACGVIRERASVLPIADVSDTVGDLLEPLCKDVHRMLVRVPVNSASPDDSKDSELRLVTQTDVLHYIISHESAFEIQNWAVSVEEAGFLHEMTTIQQGETALKGFERISNADCSALPVVDENGKLTATLSGADLRGLTSNLIQRVLLPVLEFLKETSRGIVRIPVTVSKDTTVQQAATKLMLARVHRLWVVDDDGKPIGVVSTTDVIKHLYKQFAASS